MPKANFKLALLAAFLATGTLITAQNAHAGTLVSASCMAESPTDGSIWIGSNGNGLFRLGRNGNRIQYSEKDGKIPSDSIKTLFFDASNTLWILDSKGNITLHTATEGFHQEETIPNNIDCVLYDSLRDCIYYTSGNSLRSYKKVSKETKELVLLPSPAKSMKIAENKGNFIWVFCEKGVMKVDLDGAFQTWEDVPNTLDLLPFEFETNQASTAVEHGNSTPIWLIITIVIAALLTGFAAGWTLKKKESTAPQAAFQPEPVPAKPVINTKTELPAKPVETTIIDQKAEKPEVAPVVPVETEKKEEPATPVKMPEKGTETSFKGGEFSKKVYSLIKANLSDPDFDVEAIAAITGMSRIHVNRKLKSEGAPAPSTLIKEVRMKQAARLIRQGKLGISQISSLCGFRTPSYFATAFKEYYGVSPSEFTEGE